MSNIGKDRMDKYASYQRLFNKAELLIKEDACMKFYHELNASRVGLGTNLVSTKERSCYFRNEAHDNNIFRPIAFTSKSLSAVKRRCSHI